MTASETKPISLALSGGGVRAIVFHIGVLRFLAERQAFERVCRISTVSGGSLLVGLIMQEANMKWPSSEQFLSKIIEALRKKLCTRSLQWGAARQLFRPWNWKFLLSRSNLLAMALQREWDVVSRLDDLPKLPEWSINGTTAENGKRFRFKHDSMGDYSLGYADPKEFDLADALAVSAAFPGGFGPLKIDANQYQWRKRPNWDAHISEEYSTDVGFKSLHLYDGGVYDNLGLEPLFDGGKGIPKHNDEIIIVSDAGAPLKTGFDFFALNPYRLKRISDILAYQTRALRVRTLVNYLQLGPLRGSYLYIDTPISGEMSCESASFATRFPTTLRKLKFSEFESLSNHGYQVALNVETMYGIEGAPIPQ